MNKEYQQKLQSEQETYALKVRNLQITFEFVYDDENEYIAVARSTEEIEKALVLGFYNRTQ